MKNSVFAVLFLLISNLCLASAPPHVVVYKANLEESKLEWIGKKITKNHTGTIELLSGEMRDNHGSLSGIFEINMHTILCNNLEGESKAKLEKHLKSDDFFNVEKYPVATFALGGMKPLEAVNDKGHTHQINGMLTIRDKTHPIAFTTKVVMEREKMRFTGEAVVDRSKYDVRFGSDSFFEGLGDRAIDNNFILKFDMVMTP